MSNGKDLDLLADIARDARILCEAADVIKAELTAIREILERIDAKMPSLPPGER